MLSPQPSSDAFDALAAEIGREWNLRFEGCVVSSQRTLVAKAYDATGAPVALKLKLPSVEVASEIAALRAWNGQGTVRLLREDASRSAMLLEWVAPGTAASVVPNDVERTRIVARLMARLPRLSVSGEKFPATDRWLAALQAETSTRLLPEDLVRAARGTSDELLASGGPPVLLHGDLHPGNLLQSADQGWLAIDPKGVIGEACYETGAVVRQPAADEGVLARRIDVLATELGLDWERIRAWSFVQAVLAACWAIEDGDNRREWYARCAGMLASVGPSGTGRRAAST